MPHTPKKWSFKGVVLRRVLDGRLRGLREFGGLAERQCSRVGSGPHDGALSGCTVGERGRV